MQVRSPLEPKKQCQASCRVDRRDRWLSLEAPQASHTRHRVLSRSRDDCPVSAGKSGVSAVLGISGSFEMVARALEFLSSVKLRPPPLEMRLEHRDSFPEEAGKRTLLSGGGGKTGAILIVAGPSVLLSGDRYVVNLLELPQGRQGPFRVSGLNV